MATSKQLTEGVNEADPRLSYFRYAIQGLEKHEKAILWALLGSVVVSLLSVLLNVGTLSLPEIQVWFLTLRVVDIYWIRVLLTLISAVGTLIVLYLSLSGERNLLIIDFLAKKGLEEAQLMVEFGKEYKKKLHDEYVASCGLDSGACLRYRWISSSADKSPLAKGIKG